MQCFQKLHFYKPWSHVTNIRFRGVMIHNLDSTRSAWSSCTKKAEMLGAALFSLNAAACTLFLHWEQLKKDAGAYKTNTV